MVTKTKLRIFSWGLYDFANSLVMANFILYFSQWLVIDNKISDAWYVFSLAFATLLLMITAPFLGVYSDKTNTRMKFIIPLTIVMGLSTIVLGFVASGSLPFVLKIGLSIFLAVVIQYTFLLSLVFYDTLIPILVKQKEYGKISGFGNSMDGLGFLTGLFLTFPLISGAITLYGTPGRSQAFIPAGIFFLLFAFPMMYLLRNTDKKVIEKKNLFLSFSLSTYKKLLQNKKLLLFILAFHFVSDAILTINAVFPLYYQQVFHFTDLQKILLTTFSIAFIISGSFVFGKLSDIYSVEKLLLLITCLLIISLSLLPLLNPGIVLYLFLALFSIGWGGFYAIARTWLLKFAPTKNRTEFLSMFTISRRSAALIGPLLWGIGIALFASFGDDSYRITVYFLVCLLLVGLLFFLMLRKKKPQL